MSERGPTGKISRYGKAVAKPGKGAQLAEQMLRAAALSADEPGCLQYSVNRAADDRDVIWITEVWADQAAMDASLDAARARGMIDEVRPLIQDMEMIELEPLGGLEGRRVDHAEPGFEIKNLDDFKDSAARFGFGEIGEARFAGGEMNLSQAAFSFHRINPGKRQAFGHRHGAAEEVYLVLSGSGRIKLDDEIREIGRLDAIRVSPPIARAFEAGPDGIELLAFSQSFKGDAELLQGWWSD
jgi:quinol monooxygenase YgiN